MTVVIYFQSGFMKLYVSGLDWAHTPHLQTVFEKGVCLLEFGFLNFRRSVRCGVGDRLS